MQEFYFPNWVNRFVLLATGGALAVGGYLATVGFFASHPLVVNVGHQPTQPVAFSHKLHAGQLKMDCRYCHNTVERAGHAAIPPSATCGNCHGSDRVKPGETLAVVHPESDLLKPIRVSLESGEPMEWERVHDVPDFVYFNHSVHINRGVSCVSCHGRVDKMDIVRQVEPLSMKWCLDCHRNPTKNIRDPELVTQLDFVAPEGEDGKPDWEAYGAEWEEALDINTNINCSTCHR